MHALVPKVSQRKQLQEGIGAMGVLLSLLLLVLVACAGCGLAAAAVGVGDSNVPYYSSAAVILAYWRTVLPNSSVPPAILEHLSMHTDDEKTTFQWGPHTRGDDGKVTLRWSPQARGEEEKISFRWGPQAREEEKKTTFTWGPQARGEGEKTTFRWGPQARGEEKTTFRWDTPLEKEEEKATFRWGTPMEKGDKKATFGWAPRAEDNEKINFRCNSHKKKDDGKVTFEWGPYMKDDSEKIISKWGPYVGEDEKVTIRWSPQRTEVDKRVTFQWGGNIQNAPLLHPSLSQREAHHHVHGANHNHGQLNLANLLFLEGVLTPGTVVTPYIEPSVFPAPFVRREIADSIPMTTKSFGDILSMFAPTTLTMADKIRSTLHTCEHPRPLEGEQQACATSIESMVELATSVLGTHDVRAFSSSSEVPTEGVASPSSKYKVAAVRAVTAPDDEATTMTCHGVTFPYAVFYCHAVNPTRVYEVTLQRAEEDVTAAAPAAGAATMRVLAVCHLDTTQFDPENPFFLARGLKPGDAAVCHYLSRDSVLWAPVASTQGHGQVMAQ